MADADVLRDKIGEAIPAGGSDSDTLFTDVKIDSLLAAAGGDIRIAAVAAWEIKAAHYGELVDVVEGHSTRKMSQLAQNALKMVEYYSSDPAQTGTRGHVVIGDIARKR